jgi:hypothetical protein
MLDNMVQDEMFDKVEMQTVTKTGRPAPRRITSAAAARHITKELDDDDHQDAYRRSVLQGMIDGNQPYDPEMLKEQGLAHMVNVNFMSMRANLDARASAAHEIFAEVPTLIEMRPRVDDGTDIKIHDYADIIAEEFTTTVRDWKKFLPYMDQVFRESDAYGIGVALFPDEYDWRFKSFRRGALRFTSQASVGVAENDIYVIKDSMSAVDLLDSIEADDASERGWNVEACRLLLKNVFIKGGQGNEEKYQVSPWESIQQMRRNSDPGFQSKQFALIRFSHILTKEPSSGQVTHQMLPESTGDRDAFMYERLDRYESMDKALWWLPFNYADGYARSVRGVASYMAMHDDLSNRFLCRVFDAGFMTSSILLQPKTQMDLSRLSFVRHGPYTILPPEMNTIQSSFQPQIAPLIQLREVSEAVLKNNTGMYRQHPETFTKTAQPKTARQVMEEASKEARYEKAAIAHRYDHLDTLYHLMLTRIVALSKMEGDGYPGQEEAKSFVKSCKARGVPAALISGWNVKFHMHATRALGLGSPAVQYDITNQVLEMRGLMDERGQVNAFRDWLRVRVGGLNVDRYKPLQNRNDIPSNEHSIAALENNDMMEGSEVLVGADQMHFIHVASHLDKVIIPMVQAVQQKQYQDPMDIARKLSVSLQHVSGHIAYLQQDEKRAEYVKQVTEVLKQAAQMIPQLQQEAQKMAEQQAKAQAEQAQVVDDAKQVVKDRELEAKIYEINQKAQLERMKQTSLNDARAEKTDEQMDIRRRESEAGIQLKRELQAAEIEIARLKASQE